MLGLPRFPASLTARRCVCRPAAVRMSLTVVLGVGTAVAAAPIGETPISLPGLAAPANISFDALGIPLVDGASFEDAVRLEGYLHARDRYAQMDLMRRYAAGEMAELLGPLATGVDRQQRVLRLRAAAKADLEALPPRHRRIVAAYVQGVNTGLASLSAPPAEHRLLQVKPTPWTEDDTLLVALAMCAMLNDSAKIEPAVGAIAAVIPAPVFQFLSTSVSSFDAPVIPDPAPPVLPAIPGPEVIDTRGLAVASSTAESRPDTRTSAPTESFAFASPYGIALPDDTALDSAIGSNAWLVAGSRSSTGAAILANDMHLPMTIPSVWYRVSLRFGPGDAAIQLDGVSLPGAPGIVSGSNGHIAWGFTNVEGDFIDYVVVEADPSDPAKYLVPGGNEPYRVEHETIRVRGMAEQALEVKLTRWGPIVANDYAGRPLAMKWTALGERGVNLDVLDLAEATTVRSALAIAAGWRGAQQNVMVAGDNGDIGWTISGDLPRRVGFDGQIPVSWADGARGWSGLIDGEERPRVENPATEFIVTANQRTVPLDRAQSIGSHWDDGDRAARITELLNASAKHDEHSCAAIQLDTAVRRLVRWRDAILPALERGSREAAADGQPTERARRLTPIADALRQWSGRADANDVAVAVVDRMRRRGTRAILKGIVEASLAKADPALLPADRATKAERLIRVPARDESLLRIVLERPDHLLPPGEGTWDSFLARLALEAAASSSGKDGLLPWGKVNVSDFTHPLAQAAPQMATQFGIPAHEQPGHPAAVRVSSASFGASDRLVVSPSHEANGLMQTPGGQSGDPKSPHYADLHQSWRDGIPLALRPGTSVTTLAFVPAASPADGSAPSIMSPGTSSTSPPGHPSVAPADAPKPETPHSARSSPR